MSIKYFKQMQLIIRRCKERILHLALPFSLQYTVHTDVSVQVGVSLRYKESETTFK